MTVFVLIIAVVLIGVIEYISLKNSLDNVEEEYSTSALCTEPEEQLDLILRFSSLSRLPVPYLRWQMTLPAGFRLATPGESRIRGARLMDVWNRDDVSEGTLWLRPKQSKEICVPVTAPGRGRYALGELRLFGGDFLGLRETSRSTLLYREIVVYPEEAKLGPLEDAFSGFLGDLSVRRFLFEDPVLTLGSRSYTGREPMRAISWKQSARLSEIMVKNYDHTTEPAVSVILDAAGGEGRDSELIERCFELARAVCAKLEEKGAKYDFSMNVSMAGSMSTECDVPEGLGRRHFLGVLECLGRATYRKCSGLEKLVRGRLRTASARGFVIIMPAQNDNVRKAVKTASASGAAVFVLEAEGMAV